MNISVSFDARGPRVAVRNGLRVIPRATARITDEPGIEGTIEMEIEYDPELERFAAARVSVERGKAGTEVTGASLRELRVLEYLQIATIRLVWLVDADGATVLASEAVKDIVEPVATRATPDHVRAAAQIYAFAQVTNHPALKEVAQILNVSQSTATRLVAKARERGFLDQGSVRAET